MEYKKRVSDNDSDVIMIDNPPETFTIIESSPEKREKIKKKKQRKRKVRVGVGRNNHMETLLITQKLQVKRTKFRCIIDIDTICKNKQSDSIIRFSKNVCSAQAYYERIVPICLRNNCLHVKSDDMSKSNCCKLEQKKENVEPNPRKINRIYSPISSVALTENEKDISYEDVSNGDFPDSSSEDELDTLIKRTKEREKQTIDTLKTFPVLPLHTSSPFYTNEDVASTYSSGSTHSKATLVLTPGIEAYSPTSSPNHMTDANQYQKMILERMETGKKLNDEYLDPYSPTDPIGTLPGFVFGESDRIFTTKDSRSSLPLIKVEKENYTNNDIPDFIKTEIQNEILETRSFNSLISTEELFVKRENGCDVNANFEVYIKTE